MHERTCEITCGSANISNIFYRLLLPRILSIALMLALTTENRDTITCISIRLVVRESLLCFIERLCWLLHEIGTNY